MQIAGVERPRSPPTRFPLRDQPAHLCAMLSAMASSRRARAEWWATRLVGVGSFLLALAALEIGLRVVDAWTTYDFFHVVRSKDRTARDPTRLLRLVDLIRLSDDPDIIYELEPGVSGMFQGARVDINALGQRGPLVRPTPPADAVIRLLILGDSMAFGWGVEEKDAFAHRIVERFQADHPQGPWLEMVNLAVPGYNAQQEVETLVAKGLAYAPSLVVIFLCGNDADLPGFVTRPGHPWSMNRSYLWDWVVLRVSTLLKRHSFRNHDPPKGLAIEDGPAHAPPELLHLAGKPAVRRAYERLAGLATQYGFTVVYAAYTQRERKPTSTELDAEIRPLAAASGFIVVDFIPRMDSLLAPQHLPFETLILSSRDPHPNAAYHRLIGDAIYEDAVIPWLAARGSGTRQGAPRQEKVVAQGIEVR